MTREEAIEIIRKNMPSDKSLPVYEAIQTLIPELAESEDERTRKTLIEALKTSKTVGELKFILPEPTREEAIAYLEKQKELDKMIVVSPEVWDKAISDAYENGKKEGEKQKEQKPAESISQLAVQGKGVYKICPRCKERMVRDDSMVYTSMPPQYRYECPKCGKSERDTVMYDNPKMEEQKPVVTHGETYHVDTLGTQQVIAGKMPQKPEWSEEDEKNLNEIIHFFESLCSCLATEERHAENRKWLKFLKSLRPSWKPSEEQMEALDEYIYAKDPNTEKYSKAVLSLRDDLKKL